MSEDALHRLVAAIQGHYAVKEAPPLLLSSFGQRHGILLAELKKEFGSLKAAVRAAGEDKIKFIDLTKGQEAVAPASIASGVQVQLREKSATQRQAANFFEALPNSVQIAFCVRTESGEQVAIDTLRPHLFTKIKAAHLIRPSQRIIPDEFRRPGLSLQSASLQELETLWRLFSAWIDNEKLDANVFQHGGQTTALARLLAAQPADIVSRLVIPGDIAQLLLKHS